MLNISTDSNLSDGIPFYNGSFDHPSNYEYGDDNTPSIDLPGQNSVVEEFPNDYVSDEFPSHPVSPDDLPRRDGPGGN